MRHSLVVVHSPMAFENSTAYSHVAFPTVSEGFVDAVAFLGSEKPSVSNFLMIFLSIAFSYCEREVVDALHYLVFL